jgi:hypothetical protein
MDWRRGLNFDPFRSWEEWKGTLVRALNGINDLRSPFVAPGDSGKKTHGAGGADVNDNETRGWGGLVAPRSSRRSAAT